MGATDLEEAALFAALSWWTGHRPIGTSLREHLLNPEINCPSIGEKRLASAIAAVVRERGIGGQTP